MQTLLVVLRLFNPGAESYAPYIEAAAKKYDFDPLLIAAVIHKETKFQRKKCYRGSHGLMQIQLRAGRLRTCAATWPAAYQKKLYTPKVNILRGTKLMYYWRRWTHSIGADWHWLLNYNQGFGRCRKRGCKRRERVPIQTGKVGGYAKRVLKIYEKLLTIKASRFPNG
jgi:soluble lytic murein transglycosylase-like protein